MGKSLTETAKAVLLKEDPTPNSATLRPMSRSADPSPMNNAAEDLGGATPTETAKDNLGAKAAGKTKKDTSKSGQSATPAEPTQMSEDMEDDNSVIEEELEAFIQECIDQGLTEEEIQQAIDENFEFVSEEAHEDEDKEDKEDEDEDDEDKEKEDKAKNHKKMMKEHVDALLEGEELSEDFRSKAETIFESAVSVRVNEEVAVLEEAYAQSLEEEVDNIKAELAEQVNDYLNYVVEQWVSENEVAIESGLRSELTEDFISGLRNLFAEHYIDLPEDRVDIIEQLGAKVETLETKLNEEIDRNVSLTKMINESKQFEILVDACSGLTTTQAEKLKALSENITFNDPEEYAAKVATLRESYFPQTVRSDYVLDNNGDSTGQGMISEETTGRMGAYVKALGKTKLK